jgi:endoglucanase
VKLFNISIILAGLFPLSAPAADQAVQFPSNPPEMRPLTNHQSPAFQAARLFMRGVNLGDYLEANWAPTRTMPANDFAIIKSEGFDHVRVPIGWNRYAGPGPEFTLKPEIFSKVDFVVSNALANNLAVIINIHHFEEFDRDPAAATGELVALWRQIAAHYQSSPDTVAFEIDNEPHDTATTAAINPVYPKVIAEIRKTNPRRTIFVQPGNWGGIDEIKNLVLPDDDNLIVSAHCYEPFFFTHQGAPWAGQDVKVTGFQFPGPPAHPLVADPSIQLSPHQTDRIERYNSLPAEKNPSGAIAFVNRLKFARAWSDYYGRPVHIGEFGCYIKADPDSRARFYAAFRRALDEQKLGWAMWDWNSNFHYWDKKDNRPAPGMREALFGK